jgi:hypothetical protein
MCTLGGRGGRLSARAAHLLPRRHERLVNGQPGPVLRHEAAADVAAPPELGAVQCHTVKLVRRAADLPARHIRMGMAEERYVYLKRQITNIRQPVLEQQWLLGKEPAKPAWKHDTSLSKTPLHPDSFACTYARLRISRDAIHYCRRLCCATSSPTTLPPTRTPRSPRPCPCTAAPGRTCPSWRDGTAGRSGSCAAAAPRPCRTCAPSLR